jgi:hypothetical protein
MMHKVIILNKPLKVFDFTIVQLVMMFFSVIISFVVSSWVPKEWKFNGMPGQAVTFIILICIAIALVKMSEIKPWGWWINNILYRLKIVPTIYLPRSESAPIYPDPTIIEPKKKSDDNYVEA